MSEDLVLHRGHFVAFVYDSVILVTRTFVKFFRSLLIQLFVTYTKERRLVDMYSSRLQNVTLSYFTLVSENGQVLQWVRCTVLWPFSCCKAFFRSQHESHTYCLFVSRVLLP